jgi:hypothetical protein
VPGFFQRRTTRRPGRVQLRWLGAETLAGEPRPGADFYFRDGAVVRLQVRLEAGGRLPGGLVDFVITARNPRGNLTPPLPVARIDGVPLSGDGTGAEIRWGLSDRKEWERWAFATFRFTVRLRDRSGRRVLVGPSPKSARLRHFATVAGLYGFGPTGEIFSNAEIRRLARAAGGVPVRRRAAAALRRLAAQVPVIPGDPGVSLFGYSLGGHAAVELARALGERGVVVAALFLIDPVVLSGVPLVIPANVRRAVSWFQSNGGRWFFLRGRAGRGVNISAENPRATVVENHEVSRLPSGLPTMHEDMPFLVADRLLAELGVERTESRRLDPVASSTVTPVEA